MRDVRLCRSTLTLGLAICCASLAASWAAPAARAAMVAAEEPAGDHPEDLVAVKAVCTRCHATGIFIDKPRSWNRWTEVFERMTRRGASPTEEQADHILRYFLENLTIVNANSSPADELAAVLGVDDAVAAAIVARREHRKFSGLADLASIPGVSSATLRARQSRIIF